MIFNNKVNDILGLAFISDLIYKRISIVKYKYHTRSLEYLAYDVQNCVWIIYGKLKTDEPLLVAKYVDANKDIFSRCVSYLKTWAKDILQANKECIQLLKAVTIVKSKRGRIHKAKIV